MSYNIKIEDVIKLIQQFFHENGLKNSLKVLQMETGVSLNLVDNTEKFLQNICNGKWDLVQGLAIPNEKLMKLYELICLELIELGENDSSLLIVNDGIKPSNLYKEFPERCLKLEHLSKRKTVAKSELYDDELTTEKRRQQMATSLKQELIDAPPSRLLNLLGQSIKYQELQGYLTPNVNLNIYSGVGPALEDEIDRISQTVEKKVKYGHEYRIECASFSPDGKYLATGSVDGLIELYDPINCKVSNELFYQKNEQFLLHNSAVLSICFSMDSELLCSGDKTGTIKVWRVSTGKLVRKLEQVFQKREISHVLAGSQEVRIIGLKSATTLREFRGHQGYITSMLLNDQATKLVTGSSDGKNIQIIVPINYKGTIKIWNYKTGECTMTYSPPTSINAIEKDIYNVIHIGELQNHEECQNIIMINGSCSVFKSFQNDNVKENFSASCVSSRKEYVYGVTEKQYIYGFNTKSAKLEAFSQISEDDDEITGMVHHPLKNIIVVYTLNGNLYFLKP